MNEIVNQSLVVGKKFMPEMHLRQHGFTNNACGTFNKEKKERNRRFIIYLSKPAR